MITRVPAEARESARPLALPRRYPHTKAFVALENGARIKEKLGALASEVLEIRRRWRDLERQEINDETRKSEVER